VRAPTLLIVGGNDYDVIELNEKAYRAFRCEKPAGEFAVRKANRDTPPGMPGLHYPFERGCRRIGRSKVIVACDTSTISFFATRAVGIV
jgi:hypothetical protein